VNESGTYLGVSRQERYARYHRTLQIHRTLQNQCEATVRKCIGYIAVFSLELVVLPDLSLPKSPVLRFEQVVPGDEDNPFLCAARIQWFKAISF
jgi:hypothetical protein